MKVTKSEPAKTLLTIVTGFIVVYLVTNLKWALQVSLIIGLIGILSTFLSKIIDMLWNKLAWVLSFIVPNILLSLIYFLFLFPIALLSKLFGNKDPLALRNKPDSTFKTSNKAFDASSFDKPW